jgi:hypothetical protein
VPVNSTPEFLDISLVKRNAEGDNWVLKMNNLKKIVDALDLFFTTYLTFSPFQKELNITSIAQNQNVRID